MSTKVIVIGEENKTMSEKKPIKFIRSWCSPSEVNAINGDVIKAKDYNYVELIAKNYLEQLDLIFCYNDPNKRGQGCIFLGYWNDGVV